MSRLGIIIVACSHLFLAIALCLPPTNADARPQNNITLADVSEELFPFVHDATAFHNAVSAYVRGYVDLYYATDEGKHDLAERACHHVTPCDGG
jgi:hypothetical protein